jgi:putative ABC transport system permease protein
MRPAPSSPEIRRISLPATARMALRNLSRHRRRSIVNVVGISVAVSALLFFQAFYRGSYEELMFGTIIDYQSAHLQVQTGAFAEEDPDSYVCERTMIDGFANLRQAMERTPQVRSVSARLLAPAFAGNGIRKRAVLLAGVEEAADRAVFRTLDRLRAGHHLSGPGQILVGSSLAARFGLSPGDQLRVQVRTVDDVPNLQSFTIAGLFATGYAQIDRGMVFAGLADVQELTSAGDRVNRIYLRAASADRVEALRAEVSGMLAGRGSPLAVSSWTDLAAGILEHSRTDRLFMTIFLCILVILSVATVASTMYMAVFERTREIGNLRAMGWQKGEVFRLFLMEAAMIGAAGAAAGALCGAAASLLLEWFPVSMGDAASSLEIPFLELTCRLTAADTMGAVLVGMAAAAVAGIAPARRAARIRIVTALAAR